MHITLHGNPKSTQNSYGMSGKIKYMKKQARDLKESYVTQAQQQYKGEPLETPLAVVIKLYFGDKRRRDRDNYHKLSMDSLEGIVYVDDNQIQRVEVEKHYDKNNPRIEIFISKYIVDDTTHT